MRFQRVTHAVGFSIHSGHLIQLSNYAKFNRNHDELPVAIGNTRRISVPEQLAHYDILKLW